MYIISRCVHGVVEVFLMNRPTAVPENTPITVSSVKLFSLKKRFHLPAAGIVDGALRWYSLRALCFHTAIYMGQRNGNIKATYQNGCGSLKITTLPIPNLKLNNLLLPEIRFNIKL